MLHPSSGVAALPIAQGPPSSVILKGLWRRLLRLLLWLIAGHLYSIAQRGTINPLAPTIKPARTRLKPPPLCPFRV